MLEQLLLFIISLTANTFSAFSGGGAGLLQLPALLFLGLPFTLALATHKVASVALGVGAALRHAKERSLLRDISVVMLLFGLPGVVLGAHCILLIPDDWARTALGILTISLGLYSISKRSLGLENHFQGLDLRKLLIGGGGLFLIGFLNGSLTSGTGLFVTLWLTLYFGLDYSRSVAHTLVWVGLCWNGTGALTLGLLTDIHWAWLPVLLAGSLLGGYLGAHLAIVKGAKVIKRAFETITLLVGISLLL